MFVSEVYFAQVVYRDDRASVFRKSGEIYISVIYIIRI